MPKYGFGGRTAIPLDDYKDEILHRRSTRRETQGQGYKMPLRSQIHPDQSSYASPATSGLRYCWNGRKD